MNAEEIRFVSKFLPFAALVLVSGLAQAIDPPRVMFVSGLAVMPVIIDLQGKEIPAKKGQVIPPGYSVKVPEGATVQIMTDEKAIVAVRQNSLLKLEKLGDGGAPHKFKLDSGGLRVANPEKKFHKFEVETPNAKITFDKGDHEAFYLKEGNKFTGDRWGTFVRGFKEESVLSTKDGDTKISRSVVGYVPGTSKDGKTELIDRVKVGGNFSDPVAAIFSGGSLGQAVTDLNENQRALSENAKSTTPDVKAVSPASVQKSELSVVSPVLIGTLPSSKEMILPPKTPLPISPVAGLDQKLAVLPDMKSIANISVAKTAALDQAIKPEISMQKDLTTGKSVPVLKEQNTVTVLAPTQKEVAKVQIKDIQKTPKIIPVCIPTRANPC